MELRLLYMTAGSVDEANRLARTLVEERLVACANVYDGVRSFYWWEGAVQDGAEAVVIAKTRADRVDAAVSRVRDLHSYACPCVVVLPIAGGNPAFLDWIGQEAGPA